MRIYKDWVDKKIAVGLIGYESKNEIARALDGWVGHVDTFILGDGKFDVYDAPNDYSEDGWLDYAEKRYKEGSKESNTSYQHALEVAKIYPKLKVIMAHMGGTDTTICKRAINDSRDYPNIYFDTSGITTPYIIEYAVEQIPANRILFGSDAPWCSFNAMVYTILDAQIDDDIKNAILYNNFNELIP